MSRAVILGSAFDAGQLKGHPLHPEPIDTPWGRVVLHRVGDTASWALFRHGVPHRTLPNQINYRGHAWALREVGCRALMVTSSVGVLDPDVPLFTPLLVSDLLMPDNRLPDGSACTLFTTPSPSQGHLVLTDGLFAAALRDQVRAVADDLGQPLQGPEVVFAYVGGPRTKTRAENRYFAALGAQVNSMTLGPEVVLANEAEIPCVGVVVGHKHSQAGRANPDTRRAVADSLDASRAATERLVVAWLTRDGLPLPAFANHIYRFDAP